MTELRPCQACRRHVAVHEVVCPFCRVTLAPGAPQRIVLRGRVARAAVFGAALAAGACSDDKPAKPSPARVGSGSDRDMKDLERVLDDPSVLAGSAAPPADAAPDAVAIAVAIDAGVPPDAFVDTAERKRRDAERRRIDAEHREAERKRLEAERQRELDLQRQLDRTNVAKPYGAPPARRRVV